MLLSGSRESYARHSISYCAKSHTVISTENAFMKQNRSQLLSAPFIPLYVAVCGAFFLNYFRHRLGSEAWFPMAIGLVASLATIPLRVLLRRWLTDRSTNDWWRIIFLAFGGILTLAGVLFLGREDALLRCGMAMISAILFYASLATVFKWPGFRPPLKPNECRHCRYDQTNNQSSTCPNCGTPIQKPSKYLKPTQ